MIHYLPLENLPQRYGPMMNAALGQLVDHVYTPAYEPSTITNGEFLDITGTIRFKALQLDLVAKAFAAGTVNDGDIFLLADLFFPGLDAIKYMAELSGIRVFVAGFNYAGRADSWDFVQRLGPWSDHMEEGYHAVADMVFVGSRFHANNVRKKFHTIRNLIVTGYVWDMQFPLSLVPYPVNGTKEEFVIWPHRPAVEKGIDELLAYAKSTTKRIIITSCGPERKMPELPGNVEYRHSLTKTEYYQLVSKARWYLSTAHQETFGYTLQEAILYGCEVMVPNRACYPEMVPEANLYTSLMEVDAAFDSGTKKVPMTYTSQWDDNAEHIIEALQRLQ